MISLVLCICPIDYVPVLNSVVLAICDGFVKKDLGLTSGSSRAYVSSESETYYSCTSYAFTFSNLTIALISNHL